MTCKYWPDYTFAGWYTTPQGYDNSKFNFAGATVPAVNTILYARWDKPVYTVTFDADSGGANPPTQSIPLQGKAVPPTNPTKAGYVFGGWYLPGATLRYIFDYPVVQNLTLKASWIPSENISYTVNYDVPGQDRISEVFSGNKTGDLVTATARTFAGYLPDQVSKSITIAPGENVITFTYTAATPVKYTVKYLFKDSESEALSPEIKNTTNSQVVVNYKPVPGYYPDYFQKTLHISQAEEENVIIFYYIKTQM